MIFKIIARFVACSLLLLIISGCGSGATDTNGQLSLATASELVAGQYVVTATAIYTGTAANVSGVPIKFTFSSHSASGTYAEPVVIEASTDSTGTAIATVNFTQIGEAVAVTVVATTGGLRQRSDLELAAL